MRKEKFYYGSSLHYANVEALVSENGVIVAHSEPKLTNKMFPRVTVCGIYDNEEHTMTYGVTVCSSKDRFQRKIGRELSFNRANDNPYCVVKIKPEEKISDVFIENAKRIEEEVLINGIKC